MTTVPITTTGAITTTSPGWSRALAVAAATNTLPDLGLCNVHWGG